MNIRQRDDLKLLMSQNSLKILFVCFFRPLTADEIITETMVPHASFFRIQHILKKYGLLFDAGKWLGVGAKRASVLYVSFVTSIEISIGRTDVTIVATSRIRNRDRLVEISFPTNTMKKFFHPEHRERALTDFLSDKGERLLDAKFVLD